MKIKESLEENTWKKRYSTWLLISTKFTSIKEAFRNSLFKFYFLIVPTVEMEEFYIYWT